METAGSTVLHAIGGCFVQAWALVLGPDIGKYSPDGKTKGIPGHHIVPAAMMSAWILEKKQTARWPSTVIWQVSLELLQAVLRFLRRLYLNRIDSWHQCSLKCIVYRKNAQNG